MVAHLHCEGAFAKTEPTLTPWEMQKLMGLGINLGNVLEAPFQGNWAPAPTVQHFEMFHDAGFANCRIPVCWGHHMMTEEPYTIEPKFLEQVAELVNHSLSHGMVTIITAHFEWWIDFDVKTPEKLDEWRFKALPRFEAMWKQVGEHFHRFRQMLIFGILNEPHALDTECLNELHRVALVAIRNTNPSRVVTISGKNFAHPRWLLDNPKALYVPRDPQLMLEIHVTEPHSFTGSRPTKKAWGSEEDLQKAQDLFEKIEVFGRARNLPIYVGEFGCSNAQSLENGRKAWLEVNWKEMRRKGFCASLWDDGERFSIFDRKTGEWDHDILCALQRALPGLQGVSIHRTGGGLGGDSSDPTLDLQRKLESCFSRLSSAMDDVSKLPVLEDHKYLTEHDTGLHRSSLDDSDDSD